MNLGRYQEAESLLEGQTTLAALLNRGELHRRMKKFPEARFFTQSAMDAMHSSDFEMLAVCYETMGEIDEECGDFPAAARWFTRAREKHQQCVSPNFSELKCAYENEARALGRIGDKEGAIKAKEQVDLLARVMSMVPPPNRNLHIPAGAIDPDQPINESTVIFGTRYGDEWAISDLWEMKGYRAITSFMSRLLKAASLPHDAACEGLVAAAVIACGAGQALDETTDDIKDWVGRRRKAPSSTDIATARRLVDRILSESETRNIWEMAGKLDEWSGVVRKLQAVLIL
jgi:hypothetical protein